MKFVCEKCGKWFDTNDEAVACEARHAEEFARKKQEREEKKSMEDAINKMIKTYCEKYNEPPVIRFEGGTYAFPSVLRHIF